METLTKEQTLMNVNGVDKEESSRTELIERNDIKGTPFTVISTEDKHFGVMGGF